MDNTLVIDIILYVTFEMERLRFGGFETINEYEFAVIITEEEEPETLTIQGTFLASDIGIAMKKKQNDY